MTSPAPFEHSDLPDLFTSEEAFAAGISRRALSGPGYRRLFRGGYAKAGAAPTYSEEVRFALRVVPSAEFAAQHTAARLHGGVTPLASNLHLGTRVRHKCKLTGIQLHFYKNAPDLTMVHGIPVTSSGQTFLDLARSLEFVDLLVLGDSLVRSGACTPVDLRNFVANASAHGAEHAREVAALVRRNVYSPNESRLRLLVISGGLPEPQPNFVVSKRDRSGNRTAHRKIDLAFPDYKVGLEFDGREHIERVEQWDSDILRREQLEAIGWRFVIVTSSRMYREPLRVLQRITDTLVLAGSPRIPIRDDWRRHFG